MNATIAILAGLGAFAFAVAAVRERLRQREAPTVEFARPQERSSGEDATVDDLTGWDLLHDARRMIEAREARADATEELPKADPDRTRPLPLITPSPLRRRGWMVPAPIPPRPIGPEPGAITREFGRITGTDPADGYGPDEATVLARAGARYIQPAIGWVTR